MLIHYTYVNIRSWEHQDKQLVMPNLQLGGVKLLQKKKAQRDDVIKKAPVKRETTESDENMSFMFVLRNIIASASSQWDNSSLVSPFYPIGAGSSQEACRDLHSEERHQLSALTGSTERFHKHSAALHYDRGFYSIYRTQPSCSYNRLLDVLFSSSNCCFFYRRN